MSDLTIQLLRLINEGKTLNEISEILNISHKKITDTKWYLLFFGARDGT